MVHICTRWSREMDLYSAYVNMFHSRLTGSYVMATFLLSHPLVLIPKLLFIGDGSVFKSKG